MSINKGELEKLKGMVSEINADLPTLSSSFENTRKDVLRDVVHLERDNMILKERVLSLVSYLRMEIEHLKEEHVKLESLVLTLAANIEKMEVGK